MQLFVKCSNDHGCARSPISHVVHFDKGDIPVCLGKCKRVVPDIVVAGTKARAGSPKRGPRPIAAESQIKDNLVLSEMRRGTVISKLKIRIWCAPGAWVWVICGKIRWCLPSRKIEHLNVCCCPFGCECTAIPGVEAVTLGALWPNHTTPLVLVLARRVNITVCSRPSRASTPVTSHMAGVMSL